MAIPNLKARTALAAEIAMVHRQRFNEAVAEGFYPCAPPTIRGATRVFDVNDIVTLRIYGRLLDRGMVPRSAGSVACRLRNLLMQFPEAEEVVHIRGSMGSPDWRRLEDFDLTATHISGVDIVSFEVWHLKNTRDRIVHDLEQEAAVLGSHDEAE